VTDRLLTAAEVAEMLGVTAGTVLDRWEPEAMERD
jgi:hypothetical protein